jgi:uncharacterized RDD family membrane protein YckC
MGADPAAVTDGGYEIVCNRCGAAVPSSVETCPECATVLLGQAPPPPIAMPTSVRLDAASGALDSSLTLSRPPLGGGASYGLRSRRPRELSFAGFWIRLVAWFIDWVVSAIAVAVASRILGPIGALLLLPLVLLYFPVMESSESQATLGKRICGLVVTDTRGERIFFGQAVLRYLAKVLSTIVFGIGFLMIAFHPRKRGLHDIIAGTLVLHR